MDTQEIVWIVVAVAVVVALVAVAAWLMSKKKKQQEEADRAERASRAADLREEAGRHAQVLPDAELRAKEEQLKAEKLRREAEIAEERANVAETDYMQSAAQQEDRLREADHLDPNPPTTSPAEAQSTSSATSGTTASAAQNPDTVFDDAERHPDAGANQPGDNETGTHRA